VENYYKSTVNKWKTGCLLWFGDKLIIVTISTLTPVIVATHISLFSSGNADVLNWSCVWSFWVAYLIDFFLLNFIHTWLNAENLYAQFIIFSNFNLTDKNNNHICFNEKSSFSPFMNDKVCSIIKFPNGILSHKFEMCGRRELINWFGRITLASKN